MSLLMIMRVRVPLMRRRRLLSSRCVKRILLRRWSKSLMNFLTLGWMRPTRLILNSSLLRTGTLRLSVQHRQILLSRIVRWNSSLTSCMRWRAQRQMTLWLHRRCLASTDSCWTCKRSSRERSNIWMRRRLITVASRTSTRSSVWPLRKQHRSLVPATTICGWRRKM